jgi:hypothetical protein
MKMITLSLTKAELKMLAASIEQVVSGIQTISFDFLNDNEQASAISLMNKITQHQNGDK